MALNDIQNRVEKSIFEAIRKALVSETALPNIEDASRYPMSINGQMTLTAQQNFDADLAAIRTVKGFAAEVFGHSSSQEKGLKRTPRIAIIPRRMMPGDIGLNLGGTIYRDPLDPNNYVKAENPSESTNLQLDINLVSSTAQENRFLEAILARAIGQKRYLPFYDVPTDRFLITQYNYYDIPDPQEGVEEKVYSFEIPDLYLFDEVPSTPVSIIKEITMDVTLAEIQVLLAENNVIIGPYTHEGNLYIDLSGYKFN